MEELIDTGMVQDIYVDDIAVVEKFGDCFRAIYFTWMRPPGYSTMQKVVTAKLIRQTRIVRPGGTLQRMLAMQTHEGRMVLNG